MAKPRAPRTVDTVYRHLSILCRIPREPKQIQVAEILRSLQDDGIEVTARTIQRDLVNLSRRFPIRSNNQIGQEGAVWYWEEEAPGFDAPGMDPSTALALLAARDHLKPLLPKVALTQLGQHFRRAGLTLNRVTDKKLSSWKQKVFVLGRGPHLDMPKVRPDVQTALEDALLRNRKFRAAYRARGLSQIKDHVLSPLGLVTMDGVQYMLAIPWEKANPGKFATHRFESVEVLAEPADSSSGFSLKQYIGDGKGFSFVVSPNRLAMELAVATNVAELLDERRLGKDQRLEPMNDGRFKVIVSTDDTTELRWWLMGFGDQVEVLAPQSLRDDVGARLQAAAARYQQV